MVIGVGLVAVLFAFGRSVEAVALAGLVGAFILGRGLERLGAGLVLIAALSLGACEGSAGQVDTTGCLRSAVQAAVDVAAACWPRGETVTNRAALEACPIEREPPYVEPAAP